MLPAPVCYWAIASAIDRCRDNSPDGHHRHTRPPRRLTPDWPAEVNESGAEVMRAAAGRLGDWDLCHRWAKASAASSGERCAPTCRSLSRSARDAFRVAPVPVVPGRRCVGGHDRVVSVVRTDAASRLPGTESAALWTTPTTQSRNQDPPSTAREHRQLIARHWTYPHRPAGRQSPARSCSSSCAWPRRTRPEHRRIQGELVGLGYRLAASTA
jgi:hypothetical protein